MQENRYMIVHGEARTMYVQPEQRTVYVPAKEDVTPRGDDRRT